MLGHISFAVADLARTRAFYEAAMAPIGFIRVWTSENSVGYGPPGSGEPEIVGPAGTSTLFPPRSHQIP